MSGDFAATGPLAPDQQAHEVTTFRCTPAQRRMWFLHRLDPSATGYHVAVSLRLTGRLDITALRSALDDVVARHESLRTTFADIDGEPVQIVDDTVAPELETADTTADELITDIERLRVRRFDLERGPLLVARLFRATGPVPQTHVLAIVMHHIIADGWSLTVLARDLFECYASRVYGRRAELPDLDIQYGDYAEWLADSADPSREQSSGAFWRAHLAGAPRSFELAPARGAGNRRAGHGARHTAEVDPATAEKVLGFARTHRITLYPVLLAAVAATTFRISGLAEQLVGTLHAGRDRTEVEPLIGLFVNTLPLRVRVDGDADFRTLCHQVADECHRCWQHSDTPYEQIVAAAGAAGAGDLLDVLCVLQNTALGATEITPELVAEPLLPAATRTRFDLEFHWHEHRGELALALVYDTDRYRDESMKRLVQRIFAVLRAATADPGRPIADLDPAIGSDHTVRTARRPDTAPLHVWREWSAAVARAPEDPVVRAPDHPPVPRAALHRLAVGYIGALTAAGIRPETRIALLLPAGADLVAAVLASYAVGAVPALMDPSAPSTRTDLDRLAPGLVVVSDAARARDLPHPCLVGPAPSAESTYIPDSAPAPPDSSFVLVGVGTDVVVSAATASETLRWLTAHTSPHPVPPGREQTAETIWAILRALTGADAVEFGSRDTAGPALPEPLSATLLLVRDARQPVSGAIVGRAGPGIEIRDNRGRPAPVETAGAVVHIGPDGVVTPTGRTGWVFGPERIAVADPAVDTRLLRAGRYLEGPVAEAIARTVPGCRDCVFTARVDAAGVRRIVLYVVPAGPVSANALRERLAGELPAALLPDDIVLVTTIPVTNTGTPDLEALSALPVVGARSRAAWEQAHGDGAAVLLDPAVAIIGHRPLPPARPVGPPEPTPATIRRTAPAHSHGGPALPTPCTVLPEVLLRAAERGRGRVRYISEWGAEIVESYADISAAARTGAAALARAGLRPGDPVIIVRDSNQQFIHSFWSCVLNNAPVAPIYLPAAAFAGAGAGELDSGHAAVRKLCAARDLLGDPLIVVADRAAEPVGRLFGTAAARICTATELTVPGPHPGGAVPVPDPDATALLMFTSGSTGAPKAVVVSHRNVLGQIAGAAAATGAADERPSMNWMPLDHIAGIGMFHIADACRGAEQTLVETDIVLADPLRWLELIDRYRVAISWAPNFAYALVADALRTATHRPDWDLSCLRTLQNAGEEVIAATVAEFCAATEPFGVAPDVVMPAWGMSETSSAVTYSRYPAGSSGTEVFARLGPPIAGVELRVVGADSTVLAEGQSGRLEVRGTPVTSGYFGAPDRTAEAFDTDGWFDTGDSAMLVDGELVVTGRFKDELVVNGVNYHSSEMERLLTDALGLERGALVVTAVRPNTTERVAVFVTVPDTVATDTQELAALAGRIRTAAGGHWGLAPDFVIPLRAGEIPRTELGKVQRAHLRARFARGEFADTVLRPERPLTPGRTDQVPDWFYTVAWRRGRSLPDSAARGRILLIGAGFESSAREFAARGVDARVLPPVSDPNYEHFFVSAWTAVRGDNAAGPLRICHRPGRSSDEAALLEVRTLVRALAQHRTQDLTIRLVVVGADTESVTPGERAVAGHSALPGYLASLGTELPWLSVSYTDIGSVDPEMAPDVVLRELAATDGERLTAYRAGRRYVPRLRRLPAPDRIARPLVDGGLYVLIGGAGGLGTALAERLLTEHGAAVAVIGRRPAADSGMSQLCDRLRYWHTESAGLLDEIAEFERWWGCHATGVIDLAGIYREQQFGEESAAEATDPITTKRASLALARGLLLSRPDTWLAVLSSVNAYFGSAFAASYAAAGSFADRTMAALAREFGTDRCVNVALSRIDEVGMSARMAIPAAATRARGFLTMDADTCWRTIRAALADPTPHQLVALDSANPWLVAEFDSPAHPYHRLIAHRVRGTPARSGPVDGYGRECPAVVVEHERLPERAGVIDRAALRAGPSGQAPQRPATAPSGAIEELIAGIWSEVLGVAVVSAGDSFFELGGTSLGLTRVHHALRQHGYELSLVDLFRFPTVARLAAALAESAGAERIAVPAGSAPTMSGAGDSTGRHRGRDRAAARQRARQHR